MEYGCTAKSHRLRLGRTVKSGRFTCSQVTRKPGTGFFRSAGCPQHDQILARQEALVALSATPSSFMPDHLQLAGAASDDQLDR